MLRGTVLALLFVAIQAPSAPPLATVTARLGRFVDTYGEQASAIVAVEQYRQHVETNVAASGDVPVTRGSVRLQERTLESEFAIVKTATGWVGFRDVDEVDGREIADRQGRLERLLAGDGDVDAARRISEESARFNIGFVQRNFNVPTTALLFFAGDRLDRFQFKIADRGRDAWHLTFREQSPASLIHEPNGKPVRVVGDLWVDPGTGVVHRTVLRLENFHVDAGASGSSSATIDVTYQFVDTMQMWLPVRMAEFYARTTGLTWDHLSCTADYRDYRRFQTSVRIK